MGGAKLVHQAAGAGGAGGDVNIHDGVGNPLTSTVVGADQALDVNIVAGAGAGGTSSVDGAPFVPTVTALTISGGEVDDVAPANVAENASGAFRMSPDRSLHVALWDAAGNNRGLNIAADNTLGINDSGNNISVDDGGGSLTIDDGGAAISVDDNGGSLTIDNPILSIVGGGAEATAQRVTIANDSTGLLSIDDGGGSLTVDGGVTADIRDGAGVALTSTLVGADQALDINLVQAVNITIQEPLSVDDNGGSLTVDNAALSVTGGGVEATALRVTIANDSTGILSVDDNGGSLTVDQPTHDLLNCNANIQVGDADVANGNPVPVSDAGGSLTVDGAGTSMIDDAVFTPATTAITPIAAFADDAAPDSVDEGDAGAVRMSLNRNLNVRIRDDAGNERGLNIDATGGIAVNARDGAGTALTSTLVGADQSLDVNVTQVVDVTVADIEDGAGDSIMDAANDAMRVAVVVFPDNEPFNMAQVSGVATSVNAGNVDAGTQRVVIATDQVSLTVDNPALSVVGGGAEATAQRVTLANDSTGTLTIDNPALSVVGGGVEATALRVTIANDSTGVLSVDDNAGSLTVDNPALSVVGGGAEATALRVTIANDSTGVVTVDNTVLSIVGGGAEATAQRVTIANDSTGTLTVDGTVTATIVAKEILQQPGTAVTWGSAGGETETMTMANLANNAGRLGDEHDFGATQATRWKWYLTTDMNAAPTIRTTLDIYFAWSWDGASYEGEHTGADGALADTDQLDRMHLIGSLVLDDDTDTQRAGGIFFVQDRYGAPVIFNNATGQPLTNNAALHEFRIVPMPQEIQ